MKLTLSALVVIIMFALRQQADAQTVFAPTLCTNIVTAAPNFREVNGQLYNIQRSVKWHSFTGKRLANTTNGIVVQTFATKMDFKTVTVTHESTDLLSGNPRLVTSTEDIPAGSHLVEADNIIVLNFFRDPGTVTGTLFSFDAMRVSTADYNGETLEVWDCGTPHRVTVVTTNYTPQIKVNKQ